MKLKWVNVVSNGPMKLKMTKYIQKVFNEIYQYKNGPMKFKMGQ